MEHHPNTYINRSTNTSPAFNKKSKSKKQPRHRGRNPHSNIKDHHSFFQRVPSQQQHHPEASYEYKNQPTSEPLWEVSSFQPEIYSHPHYSNGYENMANRTNRAPQNRGRNQRTGRSSGQTGQKYHHQQPQPTAILGRKVYFCYNNPLICEEAIKARFEVFGETSSFYTVHNEKDREFIFGFVTFKELNSAMNAVSQRVLNIDQNPVRVRLARERNPRKVKELRKRQGKLLSPEEQDRLHRVELRPKERFSFRERVQAEITLRH